MKTGRGFISAMAIAMIFLVSAAVITLSIWFTTQARRTQATVAGVQIRQLLIAAVPAALEEVQSHGTADRDVTVPTPVADATLTLTIVKSGESAAKVQVQAQVRGKKGSQELLLENRENTWRLADAHLRFGP